jgi:hypothetical protein
MASNEAKRKSMRQRELQDILSVESPVQIRKKNAGAVCEK